ncbi:FAD-dependent oxidoreductase [Kineobactrum salinum]|uniref:FAD-dependent oxidoreductase n=1 Tax=Kineobactrum salinum TaxID=2708301 RepID=A0A6C0TWY9_9GAMM|nr:FAD-dependent oxidoreductase [Kineobactrum salinum]QIB64148.1 FAD-dependent oxidoreductase [Kineobactrum salinum]
MKQVDLAIVGAGPAGMAAALTAVEHGLQVVVIDEQQRAGGQILRQPPVAIRVRGWLRDRVYRRQQRLLQRAQKDDRINWCWQTTVLGFLDSDEQDQGGHRLWLHGPAGVTVVHAASVLVVTGCHDLAVPFPGWNLPGVMAAGGLQAMVKSQQLVPGQRFVFAGSHPLQLIVADQIRQAGGEVAAVLFVQSFGSMLTVLQRPLLMLRHTGKMLHMARVMWRLWRAGVPIRFDSTVVAARGEQKLTGVRVASLRQGAAEPGAEQQEIACDHLGTCYSFLVASELPRQAGAAASWSAERGGWIVDVDAWQRTSVPALYAAGETTGVAGAEVAQEEGVLATLGILLDRGIIDCAQATDLARPVRRRLTGLREFAAVLAGIAMPPWSVFEQLLGDDTTLCKCQDISVGQFRELLQQHTTIVTADSAKLRSRVGMGLCQGRYCGYFVTRILARHGNTSETAVGPFSARSPIKPVPIADILASE